jgi:Ni,Fe-hydrogenase III large subunit
MKTHVMLSLLLLFAAFTEAYNEGKVTDYSNPLRGIVPKVVHKDDVDDTPFVELIEKLDGEVAFDAYVKTLMSTPEVAERITELENCLQRLANAVWASGLIDKGSGLRAATEDAAIVLKNRLEVGDVASRIRKRVGVRVEPFQNDLRLIKPSRTKAPDSNS